MLEQRSTLARFRVQSWAPEYPDENDAPRMRGQVFPARTGTTSRASPRILCLAPGDWLIVSREHTAASLRTQLQADLAGQALALVDVTDALASIEVHGPAARSVLSKGCGLDLHPRSFVAGQCARTRFAQMPVLIECIDDSPRFELSVARSYFAHLHSWLKDAAAEFEGC